MDLRDWEKIEEDDKSVTMRHPKGHTMKILTKSLPKIQQEMIKRLKLSKGGKAEKPEGMSVQGKDVRHAKKLKSRGETEESKQAEDYARDEAKGRAAEERFVKPNIKGLAHGGDVKDPGAKHKETTRKQLEVAKSLHKEQTPEQKTKNDAYWKEADRKLKHFDEGTPEGGVQADNPDVPKDTATPAPNVTVNVAPPPNPVPEMAQPATSTAEVPKVAPAQVPNNGNSLAGQAQNSLESNQQGAQALSEQAQTESFKAQKEHEANQENIQNQQNIAAALANNQKMINKTTENFANWASGAEGGAKIDPMHYQENRTSGQKVANAIGLFVGGLGVPFGGHNFAFDFLNKQIDRDIAAQQHTFENQKTVLGAYQDLFGKNNASILLAKAAMSDIYAAKMKDAAAQVGTPQAAINAKLGIAKLAEQGAQYRQEAAGQLTGMQLKGVPTGKVGPQPKAEEKKEGHGTTSLLTPNALEKVTYAARYNPMYKGREAELNKQLERAQRLERVLNGPDNDGKGGLKDLFYNSYKSVLPEGEGAISTAADSYKKKVEHFRRTGEKALSSIPVIGHAMTGAIDMIPRSSTEQEYNSSADALKTDLSTALEGLMAPTSIEELIATNTPQYGDSPQDVAKKYKFVENTIRKTAVFPDLEKLGVLKKKK